MVYGRVISTSVDQDLTQTIDFHQYIDIQDIPTTHPTIKIHPIRNRYVDVVELV